MTEQAPEMDGMTCPVHYTAPDHCRDCHPAPSGWTNHGHPIPGLVQIGIPKRVARCGGPGLCAECSREARRRKGAIR